MSMAREGSTTVLRRCLALLRRLQRGPASRQELIDAVLMDNGREAYGGARHPRPASSIGSSRIQHREFAHPAPAVRAGSSWSSLNARAQRRRGTGGARHPAPAVHAGARANGLTPLTMQGTICIEWLYQKDTVE